MVKINPEILKRLKKPAEEFKTHKDEFEYYRTLSKIGSPKNRSRYNVAAGNVLLEIAAFETPSAFRKKYLLREARKYYEKAKKLLTWPKDAKEMQHLEKTILKIEDTLKEKIKSNIRHYYPRAIAFLTLASLILASFFSIVNLTGAVVGSAKQDFFILGIIFFILGLVGVFVYVRSKR